MVKRVFPYQNHLQMHNRALRKDTAHIHFPFSILHFQLLSRRRKNHPRKSRVVFFCGIKIENGELRMENVILTQSFSFAVRIVKLCTSLANDKKEFVLSRQLMKCGTSIGANVREAQQAQSKKDFLSKISIALKEADETLYWLDLLNATDFLTKEQYVSFYREAASLKRLLVAIVKTTRTNLTE